MNKIFKFIMLLLFVLTITICLGCNSSKPRSDLQNVIESQHFVIYGNISKNDLTFYRDICEGFYSYIDKQYFSIGNAQKLTVYLYKDKEYKAQNNSYSKYGYFNSHRNEIVVNIDTGVGTLTHELLHYFTDSSSENKLNEWSSEGISSFFEKVVGYIDLNGNLVVSSGYYHPRRFRLAKSKINQFSLSELVNGRHFDKDLANSFMLFLHKKKLFKTYIKTRLNSPMSEEQLVKSIFNTSLKSIELEWKNWIKNKPIDREVDLINPSFIGRNKDNLDNWLASKDGQLVWDQDTESYKYSGL